MTKHRRQLIRDMNELDEACKHGEVSSGNWCRRCEQYGCGHYLDDEGYVINLRAHKKLNEEHPL